MSLPNGPRFSGRLRFVRVEDGAVGEIALLPETLRLCGCLGKRKSW